MLKLHTPTHDIPALEQRLNDLLAEPPERVAVFHAKPTRLQRLVRRLSASSPLMTKVIGTLKAWRLTGYSPRWLVLKIPVVAPLARKVRARWRFPREVVLHLQRQDEALRQSNERHAKELALLGERMDVSLRTMQEHLQGIFQERLDDIVREQQAHIEEQQARFEAQQARFEAQQARFKEIADGMSLMEYVQTNTQNRLGRLEESGAQGALNGTRPAATEKYADYYVALENLYRGESEAIEARFEPYLAYMREAAAGSPQDPVLDLGCGRGEWLAILRRENMHALGVDADAAMLEQAKTRAAHVINGDLLEVVEAADPGSYGAITAFQVVEHLPLEALLRLFAAAARALRPGGVIVFETPNPENLQVAAYSFWLDPTHVRPLPPPLLDHFARYFGFIDVRIVRSNPWPDEMNLADDAPASRHINKLLFCEQDYALVARKPL